MADISSIRLPTDLSAAGPDGKEAKKLKSYLYQLTEQLRYVLANLDGDNMSASYNAGLEGQSVQIAQLTEAQRADFERLKNSIITTASRIAHDYQTAIAAESDRLRTEVTEEYVARSENLQASLESLFHSQVTQTSRELNLSLAQVTQLLQQTADAVQTLSESRETWFRFTADGLEIGKSEDGAAQPYTLRIDNEKLSFLRYGVTVAYFRYNRLYVTAVEAADRVSIGGSAGEGFYDFVTTDTGPGIKWRAS